jgi:hypothetical protein
MWSLHSVKEKRDFSARLAILGEVHTPLNVLMAKNWVDNHGDLSPETQYELISL